MGYAIYVPGVDWSQKSLGKVTVSGNIEILELFIQGDDTVVGTGQFTTVYYPAFTTQRDVVWSIVSGNQYATINQSGTLTASSGAVSAQVTIRATSVDNSSVYAEKTVSVTFGSVVFYDYLQSDGNGGYYLIDGLLNYSGKLIVKTTLNNKNGWAFGSCYTTLASGQKSNTMIGIYHRRSEGTVGYSFGNGGYSNSGVAVNTSTRYRVQYTFSSAASASDANFKLFNDATESQLYNISGKQCYLNADISIFNYGWNTAGPGTAFTPGTDNFAATKFYGLELEDSEGNKLIDIKCASVDGSPVLIDMVSGKIYSKIGDGTITCGNDE